MLNQKLMVMSYHCANKVQGGYEKFIEEPGN